jgi:hypothetical protein
MAENHGTETIERESIVVDKNLCGDDLTPFLGTQVVIYHLIFAKDEQLGPETVSSLTPGTKRRLRTLTMLQYTQERRWVIQQRMEYRLCGLHSLSWC